MQLVAQPSRVVIPPAHLMERYYTHEFTYNEYPHKSFWSNGFTQDNLKTAYKALGESVREPSQLLFLNIPFCKRQCLFCICYTVITQDYTRIQCYLESLLAEIDLYHRFCEAKGLIPNIQEIHLGGGSPTLLTHDDFARLVKKIYTLIQREQRSVFSLEVDPRGVTSEDLCFYAEKGVNRLSFGVQDFDAQVQKAIGRIQPEELLDKLLAPDIRRRFEGINFDILCGLPRQTMVSFTQTIETTIRFAPDRIMLMFLNYCPDIKAHHQYMHPADMPDLPMKMELFREAVDRLLNAGYVRIGYDHFAKPTDILAQAFQQKNIHWNSLGYRVNPCIDMIGFGAGSLGRLGEDSYVQNIYDLADYETRIGQGHFPIYRGHSLNLDDKIRREVIHQLRCYFSVDLQQVAASYDIDAQRYFQNEIQTLMPCIQDELLEVDDTTLTVTDLGKTFISYICGIFDAYLTSPEQEKNV